MKNITRRESCLRVLLQCLLALFAAASLCAAQPAPEALRTEHLTNPLGLSETTPRVSWTLDPAPGVQGQSAYQIQSAPSRDFSGPLRHDTGRVDSSESHLIPLPGPAPKSRERIYWRVKIWDEAGREGTWSEPAWFEMGLLDPTDWKAAWISAPDFEPGDNDATGLWVNRAVVPLATERNWVHRSPALRATAEEEMRNLLAEIRPAPAFRKSFTLPAAPDAARLYIAGLGIHTITVNGQPVDDTLFSPVESHYPELIYYQSIDITPLLHEGENVLGVVLRNGRYFEHLKYNRVPYGRDLPLIARLEAHTAEGRVTLTTDTSWQVAPSPVLKNNFWLGECFDARLESPGWDSPGFDDAAWARAVETKSPGGRLVAQTLPPERIVRRIEPVAITQPRPGVWVFDMGKLIVGCAELRIRAPAGTAVSLRYGEQVFRDGIANYEPRVHGTLLAYDDFKMTTPEPGMLSAKIRGNGVLFHTEINGRRVNYHGAVPVDVYIARGAEAGETWHARSAYHPFRYVEVIGLPDEPDAATLTGLVIHTDLEQRGRFASSDPALDALHDAAVRSADACTHGNVNDNTGTEKQSGLTPAIAQGKGAVFFRDEAPLWVKVLTDMRAVTPASMPPKMLGSSTRHPRGWAAPTAIWSRQGVEMPWYLRLHSGDHEALMEHYPFAQAYVEHWTRSFEADGSFPREQFGDHMAADTAYNRGEPISLPDGSPNLALEEVRHLSPTDLVGAAYIIGMTRLTTEIAQVLGRESDAAHYADLAERMAVAFHEQFFRPDLKAYGHPAPRPNFSIQGSTALALYFDLVPAEYRADVISSLVEDVQNWGGLSTGMAATVPLLTVLAENGQADLALRILTQNEFPGPTHSLSFGTRTLPEIWARPDEPSRGSLVQSEYVWLARWLYETLGGIQPDSEQPGFKHFTLAPLFPPELEHLAIETSTPYGSISSRWKRDGDTIRWAVTIPWNTTATLAPPGMARDAITLPDSAARLSGDDPIVLPAGRYELILQAARDGGKREN